jgi:peroxiredoxin Q/BCP
MNMNVGQKMPDFALPNQDGKTVKLSDYLGSWVVIYVYPKDDTPNCTIQAKAFTSNKNDFEAAGIKVLGLSPDGVDSHKSFCNKFDLSVELLADSNTEVLKQLGVGQSDWKGTMFWDRTTFVVDPQGVLVKRYDKVVAEGHDQTLLKDIEELKAAPVKH